MTLARDRSRGHERVRAGRVVVLLTVVAAASCRSERRTAPIDEAAVAASARAAIGPYKAALKAALGNAMAESLPAAIEVCAKEAPALAQRASVGGVTVGRSALRLRNPENAPRAWLAPVMSELAKAPPESDAHRVVALPDGRVGYAEAIWVGPTCLLCHGPTVAPEVSAELRRRYPTDAATGLSVGDFRGVFWAELERGATAP